MRRHQFTVFKFTYKQLVANDNHPMVEGLRGSLNHTTADGGIIIKTVNEGGRHILVITGNDDNVDNILYIHNFT